MTRLASALVGKSRELMYLLLMSSTAREVRRKNLTYLSPSKLHRIEREARRLRQLGVNGDFCEFGVALGGSGIVMAKQLDGARKYHGFDVFGMIPPPTNERDGEKSNQRYQDIVSGKSSGLGGEKYYGYVDGLIDVVRNSFTSFGFTLGGNVQLHKGLFEETWPRLQKEIQTIALAHIDCDWYDPVLYCLNICSTRMPPGGAVIVDDYFAYPGARSATDDFVSANPDFVLEQAGKHVVLHRR